MHYLLDTCVLSDIIKPEPNPSLVEWLARADESRLFLSVLTVGEIQKGISALPEGRRQRELQHWLDIDLSNRFSGRILPVSHHTAADWGILSGTMRRRDVSVPVIDGLLAATAREHDLALVTRNTTDFDMLGAGLVNPWTD